MRPLYVVGATDDTPRSNSGWWATSTSPTRSHGSAQAGG